VISKKSVLLLSLCVAGSLVSLRAGPITDCGTEGGGNLQTILTTNGGVCTIGTLTFTFSAFNVVAHTSNTVPTGGVTASDITLTDLINVNGTGFLLTPTVWSAGFAGNIDSELDYIVSSASATINQMYQEIDGTVAGNADIDILEDYCLGATSLPCTPGGPELESKLTAAFGCAPGAAAAGGCGHSVSFAAQSSVGALKDIDANGGDQTGSTSTITGVVNQWGPGFVPEPATYVMSLLGLGLILLGKRHFSRS
jgi:hypothetical protein